MYICCIAPSQLTVRIGTGVRHAQGAETSVNKIKVFILEFVSINALATSTIEVGKVSSLKLFVAQMRSEEECMYHGSEVGK